MFSTLLSIYSTPFFFEDIYKRFHEMYKVHKMKYDVCYVMKTCCRLIFKLFLYNSKKKTTRQSLKCPQAFHPKLTRIKVLLVLRSGQHPCFDIRLPRELILCIILSMTMKLHVYGTRSTVYMYIRSEQMLVLYFKNLLFLFLVDIKLRKSS